MANMGTVSRRIVVAGSYGRVGKRISRELGQGLRGMYGNRNFLGHTDTQIILTGNKPIDRVVNWLKYDSVAGPFSGEIIFNSSDSTIRFRDGAGEIVATYMLGSDVADNGLPKFDHGPTVVIDATGVSKERNSDKFQSVIESLDCQAIIATNPLKGADAISVLGVNHFVLAELAERARAGEKVVAATGSCTTNAGATTQKAVDDRFDILAVLDAATIHADTASNSVVDTLLHKPDKPTDEARGRGCIGNIIPSSTGLAAAIKPVMSELAPRIGTARGYRVTALDGSILQQIMIIANKEGEDNISRNRVAQAFKDASAHGLLSGVLGVTDFDSYTTLDVINAKYAGVVMLPWLQVTDVPGIVGNLLRESVTGPVKQVVTLSAYDNEGWVPASAIRQANLLTGLITGELKTLPSSETTSNSTRRPEHSGKPTYRGPEPEDQV